MKKMMFIAALLVAGVATGIATEYTAYAEITLNKTLTLREAAKLSAAYDNGADIPRFNNTGIFVYANIEGQTSTEWIQFGINDLEGTKLAFKVAAAGEQTLTFSEVTGTKLYLVDAVADKKTEIANGGSYVFTAEAADVSAWNTTRFSITKVAPLADYYFDGETLTLGEKKEGTTATAKGFKYEKGQRVDNGVSTSTTGNTLLLSAYEGQTTYFKVTYTTKNDETREFIVNIKPDVVPANP